MVALMVIVTCPVKAGQRAFQVSPCWCRRWPPGTGVRLAKTRGGSPTSLAPSPLVRPWTSGTRWPPRTQTGDLDGSLAGLDRAGAITINATIKPTASGQTISNQGQTAFDADVNGTNESTGSEPTTRGPAPPTTPQPGGAAAIVNVPTFDVGLRCSCSSSRRGAVRCAGGGPT